MEWIPLLVAILGLSVVVCLIYLFVTGAPMPPAVKLLAIVAVILMVFLCLGHASGCQVSGRLNLLQ